MKHYLLKVIHVCAVLAALAVPSFAQESRRGLFEGNLPGGGKIVFFAENNERIAAYVFDNATQTFSFGGTKVTDGTFTITTNTGVTITGTIAKDAVTAVLNANTITAARAALFGTHPELGGRFVGTVRCEPTPLPSPSATPTVSPSPTAAPSPSTPPSPSPSPNPEQHRGGNLSLLIDASGNLFFVERTGPSFIAGFGSLTVVPAPTRAERAPGSGGSDDADDNEQEGEDEHHDDPNAILATFTVTLLTGETATGELRFAGGSIIGRVTIGGEICRFRTDRESIAHHLANISTRGFVNTGQGQLIGGFIITGGAKLVLIRASGPSLANFGVSPVLANPLLKLYRDSTEIAENDDWQTNTNASDIISSTLAPGDPKDAALLIRLEPGPYTTVVSGSDNGTGISRVEVYELDHD